MAEGEKFMKKDIHPKMYDAQVECACGAKFTVKSTKESIHCEVCSECHPFYTGTQSRAKKTGSIEKFNRKYGMNKEK
jgi:large subunit ribosomal protein L31